MYSVGDILYIRGIKPIPEAKVVTQVKQTSKGTFYTFTDSSYPQWYSSVWESPEAFALEQCKWYYDLCVKRLATAEKKVEEVKAELDLAEARVKNPQLYLDEVEKHGRI